MVGLRAWYTPVAGSSSRMSIAITEKKKEKAKGAENKQTQNTIGKKEALELGEIRPAIMKGLLGAGWEIGRVFTHPSLPLSGLRFRTRSYTSISSCNK
jgi:hypothetical protein